MVEITSDTVEVVPFPQRELSNIDINPPPSKTGALSPMGHVPTPDKSPFLNVLASVSPNGLG